MAYIWLEESQKACLPLHYLTFLVAIIVQSLSCVWLFAIPRTAACQGFLSFSVSCSLLKFMSIESVMLSNHLILWCPLFLLPSFPEAWSSPMSQHFPLGSQSIEALASASFLPMSIQGWFPLGVTGLISLLSKGLSRVFSNTTIQKHQFFGPQPSLRSISHIHTWLLEKPQFWLYRLLLAKWCLCFLICCLGLFITFLPRNNCLLVSWL